MFSGLHVDRNAWFAVQVWSGREQLCDTLLRLRGYEILLPCCAEQRQWSDRVKKVERPLFPGYLFCRLHGEAVAKVLTTPGVIRIVGDGRRPLPIPLDEIETIQRIMVAGLPARPWPFLREGQHVNIDKGPLRGTHGLFLRCKNAHRLIVSVPLLARSVAVEIDAEWVCADGGIQQPVGVERPSGSLA